VSRTPRLPDYFVARAYGVRSTVAMRYLLEQDTPWSFFGAAPEAPLELANGGLVMSMEGMLLLDRVALGVGGTPRSLISPSSHHECSKLRWR